jgi:hypothetical protein
MRPQLRTGADQMRSPRRPEPARGPNLRQSNICSNTGSVTLPTDNRQRAVRPEGLRPAGRAARLGGRHEPNRGARCPVAAPSSPPRWRSPSWSQPSRCRSSGRGGSSPTRWPTSHCLTPVRFPYPHPHRRHRQFPATRAAPGEHCCRGVQTCPTARAAVARQLRHARARNHRNCLSRPAGRRLPDPAARGPRHHRRPRGLAQRCARPQRPGRLASVRRRALQQPQRTEGQSRQPELRDPGQPGPSRLPQRDDLVQPLQSLLRRGRALACVTTARLEDRVGPAGRPSGSGASRSGAGGASGDGVTSPRELSAAFRARVIRPVKPNHVSTLGA